MEEMVFNRAIVISMCGLSSHLTISQILLAHLQKLLQQTQMGFQEILFQNLKIVVLWCCRSHALPKDKQVGCPAFKGQAWIQALP